MSFNDAFQSSGWTPKTSAIFRLDNLELKGRLAGVGYCSVVMGSMTGSDDISLRDTASLKMA
jgi:hypothetical protein